MARRDVRMRQCYNALLARLEAVVPGAELPSEVRMAAEAGVSRTVIRAVLARMAEAGIVSDGARGRRLLRRPAPQDRMALAEEYIGREELERRFLDWVLRFDVPAGTALNVTRLARDFNVAPNQLQEFLASLGNFGLVERRNPGGWRLLGFTTDYALELSDFRLLLEVQAVRVFARLPREDSLWGALEAMRREHLDLLDRIETDFREVSPLDGRFHALINSVVQNRFVAEFQKVIRLIFNYHYHWEKTMQRHRNEAALREHLKIIAALFTRDADAAEAAARAHLRTSKETLVSSLRVHAPG
ncbi:MAG: GntR family transcriptional regulator [Cypionkella sp.]|nr:GntR family transcriptional regulator [Cypionkella sp.]